MPLPTNTSNQSWITGSAGAGPIYSMLPSPVILTYTSQMPTTYFGCGIGDDYVPVIAGNFAPNSASFNKTSAGNGLLEWVWYSTLRPGVVDSIVYNYFRGIRAFITDINLNFGYTSAMTGSRWGVVMNNYIGSASIMSLGSISGSGTPLIVDYESFWENYVGDVWAVPSSSGGGIHFRDKLRGGSEVILQPLGGYSSIEAAGHHFPTTAPRHLLINNLLTDYGYFTLNSSSFHGAGITLFQYDSGIFMSDANTVSVYGTGQRFLIPSGNLKVRGNIYLPNYTSLDDLRNVFTYSGSVLLLSGSVSASNTVEIRGISASLWLIGSGSVATINNRPFVVAMSSLDFLSYTDPIDVSSSLGVTGEMYIIPNQGSGAWIRASGSWYKMYSSSAAPLTFIDGGIY